MSCSQTSWVANVVHQLTTMGPRSGPWVTLRFAAEADAESGAHLPPQAFASPVTLGSMYRALRALSIKRQHNPDQLLDQSQDAISLKLHTPKDISAQDVPFNGWPEFDTVRLIEITGQVFWRALDIARYIEGPGFSGGS